MTEIAHHFARNRADLVDAYEIESPPLDTPQDTTTVIVHMIEDIPVGHHVRLVLCDKDFHAPRRGPRYRIGPDVVRSVIRAPAILTRDDFLRSAQVHRHCQLEGDICFVLHNHVTWLDTDLQPPHIAHGEYFRVALPPSNAFNCDTSELVALRQRGWTDQEILDILFDDEAESGHSPSLLGEDDVRALARQQDAVSHDEHVAIQVICSEIHHGGSSGAFKASVPSAVPPRHDFDPKCDQCSFTDEFL